MRMMVNENLDFQGVDLSNSFRYIDFTTPFTRLLTEASYTQKLLVSKVKLFLGSIGGLAHMIVDAKHDMNEQELVSWDYEAPLTFPLPLANKKVDIRIGHILPRLLTLCQEGSKEKVKVTAGELLHSILTYLIGKSANLRNDVWKQQHAAIYRRTFPAILKISTSSSHPCATLFMTFIL